MNEPKISIVVLSFNGGECLRRCLSSVKKQIYPKNMVEIIVVDNGSTDRSVNIAKKYTDKVFVIRNFDGGYSNRASGMKMASGEYVYMILEQDMELQLLTALVGENTFSVPRSFVDAELRHLVEDAKAKLIEKGLVSFIFKEKTKYFQAGPPDNLLEFLAQRKKAIEHTEEEIREAQDMLEKILEIHHPKGNLGAVIFNHVRLYPEYRYNFQNISRAVDKHVVKNEFLSIADN